MTKEKRVEYQNRYDTIDPNKYWDFGKFCDDRDYYWCLGYAMCAVAVVKSENTTYKVGCCYDYEWGIDGIKSEISSYFHFNLGADIEFVEVKEVEHSELSTLVKMSIVDFGNEYNKYSRFVKIIESSNKKEQKTAEFNDKFEKYELDHEDDDEF